MHVVDHRQHRRHRADGGEQGHHRVGLGVLRQGRPGRRRLAGRVRVGPGQAEQSLGDVGGAGRQPVAGGRLRQPRDDLPDPVDRLVAVVVGADIARLPHEPGQRAEIAALAIWRASLRQHPGPWPFVGDVQQLAGQPGLAHAGLAGEDDRRGFAGIGDPGQPSREQLQLGLPAD